MLITESISHHTDAIGSQPGSGKRRRALDEPAMHLGVIVHHVNRFFPRVDAERENGSPPDPFTPEADSVVGTANR